jgi:hypothetical protein
VSSNSSASCHSPLELLLYFVVVVVVPTMSVQGSSPLFNLDVDQCHVILDKTIALLLLSEQQYLVASTAVKLRSLLHEHFQDDASGQSFHSMIIYGRPNCDTVTLAHFNKYVMLPRTS